MKIEKRDTASPVELRADGDKQKIVGYAAKFYRADDPGTQYALWPGVVERIHRNAFDDAVKNDDIRGLFNHDSNQILGRTKSGTLKVSVDDVGLRYEIEPADTTVFRDVAEHLRRKDVDGSSFQFSVNKDGERWTREGGVEVRELRSVKLYDVGPVAFPAYSAATSGVRSESDASEARQSHESWKAQQDQERIDREKQLREIRLREVDDLGA